MYKLAHLEFEHYPLLLAPMEDVSDPPFRYVCKLFGADVVNSEFISADGLIRDSVKSINKLDFEEMERPVGIQIFGNAVEPMVEAARYAETAPPDIIDINFGCPVKKVASKGAGSGIMNDIPQMVAITKAVVEAVKIPVTVKTRTGFNVEDEGKPDFAKALADAGCDMLCVHGRTRTQMYHGESSNKAIAVMREAIRDYDIPFFANGDICDVESARKIIDETGCDGIAIGRAARGNPWIFEQVTAGLAGKEMPKYPDENERKAMLIRELEGRLKYIPEEVAVREFRSAMPFYIKGIKGSAQIKVKLVSATGIDEVQEILGID